MSFRPTIAVFAKGLIADLGYYRNWDERDLFFTALRIALEYSECKTIEEYRQKRYGTQRVYYILSPEAIENTQEDLRFLIGCSEFPIAVDLTAGCIYVSEEPLSGEGLSALPSVFDPEQRPMIRDLVERRDYYRLLSRFRLPFNGLDREGVLPMLEKRRRDTASTCS